MPISNRIPLAERLRKLGDDKPNRYPFFEQYIDDIFLDGLPDLTGINYWKTVYNKYIEPYNRDKMNSVVAEVVARAEILSLNENEKDTLLYKLLIEPFAYIHMNERSEHEQ